MIDIENLSFSYKKTQVLTDASLSICGGGICGLLGENGAGKTTLMKVLLGLLKGEGEYSVMGFSPRALNPVFLRQIFFVPEEGACSKASPTEFAGRLSPFYPTFSPVTLENNLHLLEVPGDIPFSRLSFGQRKKASISVALSMNTRLVLMDEPTNGLDIPSKVTLRKILSRHFTPGNGRRLLISTHQVRDIEDIVNSVAVISGGRIRYANIEDIRTGDGRIDLEKYFTESAAHIKDYQNTTKTLLKHTMNKESI